MSMKKMEEIVNEIPLDLVKPEINLIGQDGNAFSILGRVSKELKAVGNREEVVNKYFEQATAGDYDHLLAVTAMWTVIL